MPTLRLDPRDPADGSACARAAGLLARGGIVALPTETVYGVGVRADDEAAVARLRQLKGREADKPFTLVLPDMVSSFALARQVSAAGRRLAKRFWPGPLTLVVEALQGGSVGLRVPGNDVTRAVLAQVGAPIALPSANPAGDPPACDAEQVLAYFAGHIDAVLDDGRVPIGEPSTVVDVRGLAPRVLRAGFLSENDIRRAAITSILFVCSGNTCRSPMAAALARSALAQRLGTTVAELPAAGYRIASAGMYAGAGQAASAGARAAMDARQIDLSTHRSQPLTDALLAEQDRVYVMTGSLLAAVREVAPDPQRIEHIDPNRRDVSDPFGGSNEVYERCAHELEAKVARVIDALPAS